MNKKTNVVLLYLLYTFPLYTMEITTTSDQDYYSKLTYDVRRPLMHHLLHNCSTLSETKKTLIALSLVSKKSYQQINCINFTKNIMHLLAKKYHKPTGSIATYINTPGARKYYYLGKKIYTTLRKEYPNLIKRNVINNLIMQGADVNFQTAQHSTTPLMKAVQKHNKQIVFLLLKHDARVNMKNRMGYVRDYSFLYNPFQLERYFNQLKNIRAELQEKYEVPEHVNQLLYNRGITTMVRDALIIDQHLELHKGKLHANTARSLEEKLVILCNNIPEAQEILMLIMSSPSQLS